MSRSRVSNRRTACCPLHTTAAVAVAVAVVVVGETVIKLVLLVFIGMVVLVIRGENVAWNSSRRRSCRYRRALGWSRRVVCAHLVL